MLEKSDVWSTPAWELNCPHCGHNNTHHGRVIVFNRAGEDSMTGLRATVDGAGVAIGNRASRMDGNPSARRDGVVIEFSCEGCWWVSVLEIVQHKGTTYLATRAVREEKGSDA